MFKRKRKKNKLKKSHLIKNIILSFISLGFIVIGVFVLWASSLNIPDFSSFSSRKVIQSTKIYDRTGKIILYDIHKNIKRTVVPFNAISNYVKNATVAIEDDQFYSHIGIKPLAILRAVFIQPLRGKGIQGGSTITQQVIKNSILTNKREISRKLKEWVLAIKLERVMTKNQILSLYLNEVPYGGNIYGVEEASREFFGKSAKDLTLAESAYLASLPQAPTRYSPYGNNKKELDDRKNLVLNKMLKLHFITTEEYKKAIAEKVKFLPQDPFGIKAPHFVTWVKEYLVKKYGEQKVNEGGLKVITTLNYSLQKKAEKIVKKYGDINVNKFNATNAGMIGIDPKTGQILVMVGSRNYFDRKNEGNFNVTLAHRQPGSTFKPFVYATAFMEGYTPDTVVFDLKTQFQTTCDSNGKPLYSGVSPKDCYMPKNYDGLYKGPITLRDALAQSRNIPAIKTLYLAGIKNSINTAKKMGITNLGNANEYGLTLVLGGGEVSLLDITSAYSVFANNGIRNHYVSILKVEDNNGNVLEKYTPKPKRVIPEFTAEQISDILSDNVARTPEFGSRSPLYFKGRDVAVKTGTTNNFRDVWTIGYIPSFTLGAWVGNNDNTPMKKKIAGYIITPMWHAFMKDILDITPIEKFKKLDNLYENNLKPVLRGIWRGDRTYYIDKISGKLATKYTPKQFKEEKILTQVHNILYWVNKKDPRGNFPIDPEKDYQFNLWEKPVRAWVKKNKIIEETKNIEPKEFDNVHTPELSPIVNILSPINNSKININQKTDIKTNNIDKYPISKIDFFINNTFIGSSFSYPFNFSFIPSKIQSIKNINQLKVIVYDSILNKTEKTISFVVSK